MEKNLAANLTDLIAELHEKSAKIELLSKALKSITYYNVPKDLTEQNPNRRLNICCELNDNDVLVKISNGYNTSFCLETKFIDEVIETLQNIKSTIGTKTADELIELYQAKLLAKKV